MKKFLLIITLASGLISGNAFAGTDEVKDDKKAQEFHIERQTATIVNEKIYFNITLDVETENCIYSLVRFNADESMESVGIKEGLKNLNNLQLLYSFKEEIKPEENVEYVLYRIGSGSEAIAKWSFNSKDNKIESLNLEPQLVENQE